VMIRSFRAGCTVPHGYATCYDCGSMDAVQITDVTKTFGAVTAVDGLSLTVPEGSVYGFIGPNGSGKTTTMRMISSIFYPDRGDVRVFGRQMLGARSELIGYLPEERGLYRKMAVQPLLEFYGELRSGRKVTAEVETWLKKLDLAKWAAQKVQSLSKGMSQKVQFIAAVVPAPRLLILDEPFSGLDPVNAALLMDTLLEKRKQGRAILFSTHRMDQVEKFCDQIALLYKGKTVLQGSMREVKSRYPANRVHVTFIGDAAFLDHPAIASFENIGETAEIVLKDGADAQPVLRQAVAQGARITRFEVTEPTLEEIFIETVGENVDA